MSSKKKAPKVDESVKKGEAVRLITMAEALVFLGSKVDALKKNVETIKEKIKPVLTTTPDEYPSQWVAEHDGESPFTMQVRNLSNAIQEQNEILEYLINKVNLD